VILLTPVAIDWQLVTAMNRLLLQVLPVLLVAAVDKVTGCAGPSATESRATAAA
jgi:hypothetical protein